MNDIKNFMKIFTGYNISHSTPSQNLVKSIIIKRKNLAKVSFLSEERTKIKIPTTSEKRREKPPKRLLLARKSHDIKTHSNVSIHPLKHFRLNSMQ